MMYEGDIVDNIEEDLESMTTEETDVDLDDEAVRDSDDELQEEDEDDMEAVLDGEEEDIQNDPVRREHFSYSEYSANRQRRPRDILGRGGQRNSQGARLRSR